MDFEEVFQVLDANIFTKTQRRLKDVERFVLWGAWRGQTYNEMAKDSDYRYTPSYLKQDVGPKLWKLLSQALEEEVSKTNFRAALERRVRLQKSIENQKQLNKFKVAENNAFKKPDDQEISKELANLEQWLAKEHYQSLILLDNERIDKTVLAKGFEGQTQQELESVIWRSLLHTPPFENILVELLQYLSYKHKTERVEDSDSKFLQLMERLRVVLQKILAGLR